MKEELAFNYMLSLIDCGVEFPDAQWEASKKYHIACERLAEIYDEQYA
jgi:hypothetical protein